MENKRKRGRPPGEHGPYKSADDIRTKYMIRLPRWVIERVKQLAEINDTSIGKVIEAALIEKYNMKYIKKDLTN